MTEQELMNEQTEDVVAEAPAQTATTTETDGHNGPVNIRAEALVEVETITEEDANYPSPKGAFIFVMMMLTFYALYWTLAYFEIFVFRGG